MEAVAGLSGCTRCHQDRGLDGRGLCNSCSVLFYNTRRKLPEDMRAGYTVETFIREHPSRLHSARGGNHVSSGVRTKATIKDRLLSMRREIDAILRELESDVSAEIVLPAADPPEEDTHAGIPPPIPPVSGNGVPAVAVAPRLGSAKKAAIETKPDPPALPPVDYRGRLKQFVGDDPDYDLAHRILSRLLQDTEPMMPRDTLRLRMSVTVAHHIIGLDRKTRDDANRAAVVAFALLGLACLDPGKQAADPCEKRFHFYALKMRKVLGFEKGERFDRFLERLMKADKTSPSDKVRLDELYKLFLPA